MTTTRQALERLDSGGRLECYADHGLIVPGFPYDYAQFEPVRVSKRVCLKLFKAGLVEADDRESSDDSITWYRITTAGRAALESVDPQ